MIESERDKTIEMPKDEGYKRGLKDRYTVLYQNGSQVKRMQTAMDGSSKLWISFYKSFL